MPFLRYDGWYMHAIVLDGHLKSALATVRALGMAGIQVTVGAVRPSAMALYSKYAAKTFVYPSPYTAQTAFIEALKREAESERPVVYAFSDATVLSLYQYRDALQDHVLLKFPEAKSMEIAFDKAATYSLAKVSGIPTIPTYMPVTPEELRRVSETVSYPAVVKTRRSVTWNDGTGVFGTAMFVHSADDLKRTFVDLSQRTGVSPLVQDLMHGEEYGVEMLAQEGRAYAIVVHRRLRSLAPTGGASVLKETVEAGALKEKLVAYARTLVEKLTWEGPVMVEFKVDADTREPYLMEINGRFWGSLPLSIFAGVDFPLLYHSHVANGDTPSTPIEGKDGIVSVHRMGDLLHLLRVLFARDRMRKILYPKRLSALRSFFMLPKGTRDDVWSKDDPAPAYREIADILKTRFRK